ncbi:MAG: hypothetical protein J6E46_12520 [Faecalicoccus sp.]|nr:hypothetical protein [Faecalicoccus sp.]
MRALKYIVSCVGLWMVFACPAIIHAEEEIEIPEVVDQEIVEDTEVDIPETQPQEITVEEEVSVEDNGPTNEELFEHYVDQQFGIEPETPATPVLKRAAKSSTIPLEGINNTLYDLLADKIAQVAAGNIESTVFNFTDEDLHIEDASYTKDELGVTAFVDGNTLLPEAKEAYYEKIGFDLAAVNKSLLYNHPYELYWYDKITSGAISQMSSYSVGKKLHMNSLRISMMVSTDFSKSGDSGTYYMNTESASSVQDAVETAQGIVDQYASYNDYDKLVAYKDVICDLVNYNNEAAHSTSVIYGNPWQMIWVFDGDDSTTVVCEGYAKAFDYLCSKSTFKNPNLDCYLVSGIMGDDGHMWNIVTFGDNNYMVDITNCDVGTIGYPDKLFLVGNGNGNVEDGYIFTFGKKNIHYTYDDSTNMIYTPEQLTLSANNYIHAAKYTGYALSLEGNIGVLFYMDLVDAVSSDDKAYVEFTVDGVSNSMNLSDASILKVGNVNYYRFSTEVSSVQMTSDIKVKIFTSAGDTGFEDHYSVKKYCDKQITNPSSSEKLVNLCKALLNYGGYAQTYFGKDVNNLANADLEDTDVSDVTVNQSAPYEVIKTGSQDGITYSGSALVLDSLTTVKHYFRVADGHRITEFTFKLGDKVLTPTKSGTYYYIEIPNIVSNDLDTMYEVTVGNYSISYSALSYVHYVLSHDSTNDLKNLCRALYKYNEAANVFFN